MKETKIQISEDKKKPIISIISATIFMRWMTEGIIAIYNELGEIFELNSYFLNDVNDGKISKNKLKEAIFNTDIMLIDIRGHCLAVDILEKSYKLMEQEFPEMYEKKQIITLLGGNPQLMRLTKLGTFKGQSIPLPKSSIEYNFDEINDITDAVNKGMKIDRIMRKFSTIFPIKVLKHIRNWAYTRDYWANGLAGVADNHKNLLLFLLKNYLGYPQLKVPKPIDIPDIGIFDPVSNVFYDNLKNMLKIKPLNPNKQTIGLFFYGGLYFEQSLPIVKELAEKLSDFNIITVFSSVMFNVKAHREFFFLKNRSLVSLIINLQYFQLNGGPFGGNSSVTLDLYKEMNIQHINPIIQYDLSYEDYLKSTQGSLPINQIISIVMPELDGRIEMMTVGCMQSLGYSDEIHSNVMEILPLSIHIDLVVKRAKKWLNLRIKKNSEKKIAIIIYNYPPSEDKIGNAAYLDVSSSIKNLMNILIAEGYDGNELPDEKTLSDLFLETGALNQAKYINVSNFKGSKWLVEEYLQYFQKLPDQLQKDMISTWGDPPGIINVDNSYFKLPILQFGNIIIALQPARSMVTGDPNDYHDKNLPPHHQYLAFYRYLEKVLKIDALIHFGTHGTVEFLPGKETSGGPNDYSINLIGSMPNLYYYHITNTSESAIAKRRGNAVIINHAGPTFKNSDLYQDYSRLEQFLLEYQKENDVKQEMSIDKEKENELEILSDIRNLAEKLELNYNSINELEDILYRYKTAVIPMGLHVLGKKFTLEEKKDLILQILLHSGEIPAKVQENLTFIEKQNDSIRFPHYLARIISFLVDKSEFPENLLNKDSSVSEILNPLKNWVIQLISNLENPLEIKNIIRGLEGGFIEPGLGGDPIRSPHIYPSGRNSYGFDPRLIPSTSAFQRGGLIAEKLIQNYKIEHGSYPETTSVILWAFETMKTGGETIGQIFNYLGVQPVKNRSVWTTELEIIPIEEMTHPRINVFITICGIFRDTFPYLLNLLNEAVELVEQLDEPIDKNYVKKSTEEFSHQGMKQPQCRIFGPAPGKYNSNLTEIISAGVWEEESELAEDFINCMSFAYLKNQRIEKVPETFIKNISKIEIMSQVRDSSEYHITDLDHYFEFTGGLARVYQATTKKQANIYIADTTSKNIKIDPLEKSIDEGLITRSLNPQWINAMLNHKYHGGQKVAERVENVLGLASTTKAVKKGNWDKIYSQYFENKEIKEALIENNRFSMMDIIKNMLQANNRGYWNATDDQINNLKKLYLELENWMETNY